MADCFPLPPPPLYKIIFCTCSLYDSVEQLFSSLPLKISPLRPYNYSSSTYFVRVIILQILFNHYIFNLRRYMNWLSVCKGEEIICKYSLIYIVITKFLKERYTIYMYQREKLKYSFINKFTERRIERHIHHLMDRKDYRQTRKPMYMYYVYRQEKLQTFS